MTKVNRTLDEQVCQRDCVFVYDHQKAESLGYDHQYWAAERTLMEDCEITWTKEPEYLTIQVLTDLEQVPNIEEPTWGCICNVYYKERKQGMYPWRSYLCLSLSEGRCWHIRPNPQYPDSECDPQWFRWCKITEGHVNNPVVIE